MIISKVVFLFVCAFFLAGCVPVVQTSPPIIMPTVPAPAESTATSTEAPTAIPAPTEIPVGAINPDYPNAGPRPDGATVYWDGQTHEWAKPNPENPEKPFYQKYITDPNTGEVLKQDWFTDIGKIPSLMEEMGNNYKLPVNFWCPENLLCPTITHEPSATVITKGNSFSRIVLANLEAKVTGKRLGPSTTSDEIKKFRKDLDAGNVVLPYETAHGSFTFNVNAKTGIQPSINVFVVDESTFDTTPPGFNWKFWKSITIGDKDGNANIIVSTQNKKKPMQGMTPEDFRDLVMFPVARFIVLNKQNTQGFMEHTGSQIDDIMIWSTKVYNGYGPFLQITYPSK